MTNTMANAVGGLQKAANDKLSEYLGAMPGGLGPILQAIMNNDQQGIMDALQNFASTGAQAGQNISGNDLGTGGLSSNAPQISDVSRDVGMEGR